MLDFIFEVFRDVFCYKTGLWGLYILSFGRLKPADIEASNSHFVRFLVQFVGLAFYAALFYGLIYYLKYKGLL